LAKLILRLHRRGFLGKALVHQGVAQKKKRRPIPEGIGLRTYPYTQRGTCSQYYTGSPVPGVKPGVNDDCLPRARDLARAWILQLEREEGILLTSVTIENWLMDSLENLMEDLRQVIQSKEEEFYDQGYDASQEACEEKEKEYEVLRNEELAAQYERGKKDGYQKATEDLMDKCNEILDFVDTIQETKERLAKSIAPSGQALRLHKVLRDPLV
jgi:ElaB/YqjD/DUF883 family membrane-anchored ribosome-binding protein